MNLGILTLCEKKLKILKIAIYKNYKNGIIHVKMENIGNLRGVRG